MLAYLLAMVFEAQPPVEPLLPAAVAPPISLHIAHPCARGSSADEIVVCGKQDMDARYRLRPADAGAYADAPVRAEIGIFGNGKLSLHNEDGQVGGGQKSRRMMLTLKLPF